MIRGLYTAATGMNAQAKKMDVISNDLANVDTTGYKKDTVVLSAFNEVLITRLEGNSIQNKDIGSMSLGVRVDEVYTQFAQGSLVQTDGVANLAIQGEGFFVVQTPAGEAYTRDGQFSITVDGRLVTQEGYSVMGENGPIEFGEDYLQEGGVLAFDTERRVLLNEELIDTLDIAVFEDTRSLTKMDNNLLQSTGAYENGMGVSVGRIREDHVYDWKFVGLSHNTVRGAAGGAVLCAELLKAQGYITKK